MLKVIIWECVVSYQQNISVSRSALLRQNNHEVHKFIILLWESYFWYFCSEEKIPTTDSAFPDPFPFYVTPCLLKPLFQIFSCFVCLLLSFPPLLLFCRWVLLLFPSYHQWDLDPIQSKNRGKERKLIPKCFSALFFIFIIRSSIRGPSLERSLIHASRSLYKYLVEILIKTSNVLSFPQGDVLSQVHSVIFREAFIMSWTVNTWQWWNFSPWNENNNERLFLIVMSHTIMIMRKVTVYYTFNHVWLIAFYDRRRVIRGGSRMYTFICTIKGPYFFHLKRCKFGRLLHFCRGLHQMSG